MRADRQYVRARADTKMVISDHGAEVRSLRFVHTYRVFLSDPSPIIAMHWPPSLTHSWIADLTDVTLAFEDANSKSLDVVSFANVDAEERVGRYFGRDSEAEAWSKFWSRYQST